MKKLINTLNSKTRTAILLFLIFSAPACWFLFSCSPTNDIRNVILISIDTCRADYLSCYGYPRQTTPHIDSLTGESILFTNVYSPVPQTLPAHSSMLTGTIPPYHGVHDNSDYALSKSNQTLAEILGSNNFATGAIISSKVMVSRTGLRQGFDYYNDHFSTNERRGEDTNRVAFEWIDRHKKERFFLLIHYFDPHHPYEPPEPFSSRFPEDLYAGEIAYTDYCVGQIIAKLKKLGIYDSSLIIITSDHGEMLGEHGEPSHSYFIYQSAVKVPLIFKLPGHQKSAKIDDPAGIIDIVPTVCSLLGIQAPSNIQGENLAPYFTGNQGSSPDRYLYCESLSPTRYKANSLLGIVTNDWKYIQTTRPELYNLASDPGETRNLVIQHPNRARILKDRLKQILENSVRKDNIDSKAIMSEEEKNRLESLGYLAGTGVNEDFDFDQTKVDPKDLIGFHSRNCEGIMLTNKKQFAEAKALYEEMIKKYPQNSEIHYRLAKIASQRNELDEGIKHLKIALQTRPDSASMQSCLGYLLTKQGRLDDAVKHFNAALEINPMCASIHNDIGHIFEFQGKIKEAFKQFNTAIEIDPDYAKTYKHIGALMIRQGDFKGAIAQYSKAVTLDPDFNEAQAGLGEAHFMMGNLLVGKGEINEAIAHFQETLRLNHNSAEAHTNLGYALNTLGNGDEAIMHYHEAIRIDPEKSINAYYNLACIHARRNEINESIDWLKKAIDKGFNDWDILKTDKDLENIRKTTYYIEITNRNISATKAPHEKED